MPEGDTVWRTATKLREALAGKALTRCDVRVPKFATVDLTGSVVDEVLSRGKHLFIRVGRRKYPLAPQDGRRLARRRAIRRVPAYKIRIILETADSRAAGVDLGVLEILTRERDMDAVAHLGPDLLGADWDPGIARANLMSDPDRPLAEALLDQRVMAGVGNVYANELCFVTGYLPTTPVGVVKDPLRMVQRARDMLWLNRSRVNRTTTGDTRSGRDLWVYGRVGRAVPSLRHAHRVGQQRRPGQLLVPGVSDLSLRRNGIPADKVRVEACWNMLYFVWPQFRGSRQRQLDDLAHDAAELPGQRAAVVRDAVALADLPHLARDLRVAVRRDVGEQVVLDLVAGCRTGCGTACRRSGSPSRAAGGSTTRRASRPRSPPWRTPASSGKWPQKMIMNDHRLRTRFAVTLPANTNGANGPASSGNTT